MILLKKVTVIDKQSSWHHKTIDILIEDDIIKAIASTIDDEDATVIEEENLHVSIGWIDSSVCLGEPGFEDRQTIKNGLDTAAASGFTHIMMNPDNQPNPQDASGIKNLKNSLPEHAVSILPVGNLSINQEGKHLAELYDMQQAGAVSFYDFKKSIGNSNLLKLALEYSGPFHGVIQSFPQDNHVAGNGLISEDETSVQLGIKSIPKMAESIQIARDLAIAAYSGNHLHIPTVSTIAGLELIKAAKQKGTKVTCSVAIANFATASPALLDYDTRFKLQPPLRDEQEISGIKDFIEDGTIDMITSDHIPRTIESKKVEFDHADYGSASLESAFGIANLLLDSNKTVELFTAAYNVFNLPTTKIEEGQRANLTLFNPDEIYIMKKHNMHCTSKNNMFLDRQHKGKVIGIINKGKLHLND
ncbi:dihydroorotase [Nonlabens ponticola]|uniref:Dihydroorotase n=1 Tax=Nonlabens ponticola TaxID=2496866 RepID=A0A3S9MZ94_9FLAO|nr:dihydroorotase [Nonlabens ponticola]AZQ44500.1 dihydroorotase [Nonlabens ponticola]